MVLFRSMRGFNQFEPLYLPWFLAPISSIFLKGDFLFLSTSYIQKIYPGELMLAFTNPLEVVESNGQKYQPKGKVDS